MFQKIKKKTQKHLSFLIKTLKGTAKIFILKTIWLALIENTTFSKNTELFYAEKTLCFHILTTNKKNLVI